MTKLTSAVARWYFSSFPVIRGKWRLWEVVGPWLRPDDPIEVERTIAGGIRIRLNLADAIDKVMYYWDCFEPYETWAAKELLRPGDTFIDLGANVGYFTLLASTLVGKHGKVIAFEPVPPSAARLKENVALNNLENVLINECAVSDRPGMVKIGKRSEANSGMNTMRLAETMDEIWEVPAVRLDDVLPHNGPLRLLKIDVEGAELLALKGFANHLRSGNPPHVLCEVTDSFLKELGGSADELYSFMANLGYHAYSCKNRKFTSISLSVIKNTLQSNVLFSKQLLV